MSHELPQQRAPLISVVMPVYNSAKFLPEAIESILSQSLKDFELLIIYDESSDDSLSIIDRYQNVDSRVKLVNGTAKGLASALNQGLDVARGKFIARMDADDISLPERFSRQVSHLEREKADICGCHWFVINEMGGVTEANIMPLSSLGFPVFLSYTVPFAHGSVMMRAAFIEKFSLRYSSKRCAEDYDLWIRFFNCGAVFSNVDEFLFKYRELGSSLSNQIRKRVADDTRELRRQFVRSNPNACLCAIRKLADKYEQLTQIERVYILMASYVAMTVLKAPIIFDILRKSSKKSLAMAFLFWVRGI